MTLKLILILAAIVLVEGVVIYFQIKKAISLSRNINELKKMMEIKDKVYEEFSEIDKQANKNKEKISSGSATDRLNASLDILRDIENSGR